MLTGVFAHKKKNIIRKNLAVEMQVTFIEGNSYLEPSFMPFWYRTVCCRKLLYYLISLGPWIIFSSLRLAVGTNFSAEKMLRNSCIVH